MKRLDPFFPGVVVMPPTAEMSQAELEFYCYTAPYILYSTASDQIRDAASNDHNMYLHDAVYTALHTSICNQKVTEGASGFAHDEFATSREYTTRDDCIQGGKLDCVSQMERDKYFRAFSGDYEINKYEDGKTPIASEFVHIA
ncbi:hypothetical protein SeMB42_g07874 [Synchytrium endobioticum]|nr:hypothetical protein SeMB42_g07874 [Synchytrium endobioticum]